MEQPTFGLRLKALRLEHGLSQAALADGIMSTGYLSRLESGARPPTGRVVEMLAQRLGVSVSSFETAQAPTLAQVLAAVTSAASDDDLAGVLTDALRTGDGLEPALRWQALWLLARMRGDQAQHEQEHELLTELSTLSDTLGADELRARARIRLSRCVRILGDNVKARQHAEEAYELAQGLAVPDRAAALQALVSAEAEAGRLAEASAHADELCELTEQSTGTLLIEALWASATVRIRQGDYDAARRLLERALAKLDSREDLMLWLRLRLAAASLYLQITPTATDRASALLDEVSSVLDLVGTDQHKQQMLTLRAHLAFEEGRTEDARELCRRIDREPLLLSFRDRIRFRVLQSELAILAGEVEEGAKAMNDLGQQARDSLNVELAAEIWRNLAKILAQVHGVGNGTPASAKPAKRAGKS
ncbi:helix-turn-helix domain-containing protein [Amycolatopsis sp. NPDC059021]|uniref:helix-turn-helix domain-containing protein n=1 Tax=Amycolatopsis sp. NPDC059021 TaxID=3346704 RepID=UPI00366B5021